MRATRRKLQLVTLLLSVLAVFSIEAQAAKRIVALLVVECEAKNGLCETQHLVRYRFSDGELVSKDTVLTTSTNGVRFDLGQNRIYRNRYVITNWADIIDVPSGKVLHSGPGEYVAAEADRIITHVEHVDVRGYFYFDLKTNRYSRLRGPNKWALPGVLSPDQTKSVSANEWISMEVWLHTLKRRKKFLGSGFTVRLSEICCDRPRPPLLWLDNDRILTQKSNGEIVILRLNGTVEPLVKIPIEEPSNSNPSLDRNLDGRIVYYCSGEAYVIDVENKKYSTYEWQPLGSGFEEETELSREYGRIIRFNGLEIGRWWSGGVRTTSGFVALEYGDVGSNLGYPKGVKVWNNITEKWTTLDAKWHNEIIGWIEE